MYIWQAQLKTASYTVLTEIHFFYIFCLINSRSDNMVSFRSIACFVGVLQGGLRSGADFSAICHFICLFYIAMHLYNMYECA